MERKRYVEVAMSIGALVVLSQAMLGAFSLKSKKEIWNRDGGQSAESGDQGNLECAHYDHSRENPLYNDPSNGRLLTRREHYLDHFYRRDNGLSQQANEWAVKMIWDRLSKSERKGLPAPDKYHQLALALD